MTSTTDDKTFADPAVLLALAERCEREEPSRKLDLAISAALNNGAYIPYTAAYTTSLDAAVTLVPEEWAWRLDCWQSFTARVFVPELRGKMANTRTSPALALCAAALRARMRCLGRPFRNDTQEPSAMNERIDLLTVAKNAAATIGAIYEWVGRVEKAGGATSLEGVAACHAMLKSLRENAARTESLVMVPLRAAIASAEVPK